MDPTVLYRMTYVQRHRGPDGVGYVFLDPLGKRDPEFHKTSVRYQPTETTGRYAIGFGHRRLAILDLSDRGHQPMATEDWRCWIVYNGEIYNYKELRNELRQKGHDFRSESDTEVLLHAYREWGLGCFERLNGMFAFALWDGVSQQLVCARDRFGEKPFYYLWDGECFAFASEIKGLLPLLPHRRPDQQIIHAYLDQAALDYSDRTMLAGVLQLPPAHYFVLRHGKLATHRYWDLPAGGCKSDLSFEQAAETLAGLFHDSIKLRLRSDVPIGSCLSGGLDSSSIVCTVHRLLKADGGGATKGRETGQHAFSSCFEQDGYDERSYRNYVVEQTGVNVHDAFPSEKGLVDEIGRVIWHQEEPFGSTSVFAQWCVMRLAAEQGLKVLLDGQGADELLVGYHGFYGPLLADMVHDGQWMTLLREMTAYRALHGPWPRYVFSNLARAIFPSALVRTVRQRLTGSAKWIDPEFHREWNVEQTNSSFAGSRLQNMQARLLTGNGLRALLHYEDRNAMAFGIETRLPFLDHRLVDALFPLPNHYKIQKGWTKVLLREAMKGVLPEPVRLRVDKMGFVTPETLWLRGGLRQITAEMLSDSRTKARGYLNVIEAEKEFAAHVAGRKDASNVIWRWLNLELWSRQFIDADPSSAFSGG